MSGQLRWLTLFLNCLILIGNYYAYDNPAALATLMRAYLQLPEEGGSSFDFVFGLFYSAYSLPNVILPFLAGHLIDKLGVGKILPALSVCVCVGQALFLLGVKWRLIWLMLLGRTVFGIGGESVSVAQSCITTRWFHNKELALALGLNLAVPRAGSVLNAMLSPLIAVNVNNKTPGGIETGEGVVVALGVGLGMCVLSMLAALVLVFWLGCDPPMEDPVAETETVTAELLESPISSSKASRTPSIRSLPRTFWLLCTIVMLVYGTIIPFNNILSEFLQYKWFPGDPERAGQYMGIPDSLSAFLVPLFGYLVDRFGYRARLLTGCCLAIAGVHLMLLFAPRPLAAEEGEWDLFWAPVLPLIILGVAYSIFGVAYWSSIACLFTNNSSDSADKISNDENGEEGDQRAMQGLGIIDICPTVDHQAPPSSPSQSERRLQQGTEVDANTGGESSAHYNYYRDQIGASIKRLSMATLPVLAAARLLRGTPSPYLSPIVSTNRSGRRSRNASTIAAPAVDMIAADLSNNCAESSGSGGDQHRQQQQQRRSRALRPSSLSGNTPVLLRAVPSPSLQSLRSPALRTLDGVSISGGSTRNRLIRPVAPANRRQSVTSSTALSSRPQSIHDFNCGSGGGGSGGDIRRHDETTPLLISTSLSAAAAGEYTEDETQDDQYNSNNNSGEMTGGGDQASHLALAYGISTAAMNTSLTIVPLLAALIRAQSVPPSIPDSKRFLPIELFFVGEALVAALVGFAIYQLDRRSGNNSLERSHWIPSL